MDEGSGIVPDGEALGNGDNLGNFQQLLSNIPTHSGDPMSQWPTVNSDPGLAFPIDGNNNGYMGNPNLNWSAYPTFDFSQNFSSPHFDPLSCMWLEKLASYCDPKWLLCNFTPTVELIEANEGVFFGKCCEVLFSWISKWPDSEWPWSLYLYFPTWALRKDITSLERMERMKAFSSGRFQHFISLIKDDKRPSFGNGGEKTDEARAEMISALVHMGFASKAMDRIEGGSLVEVG